MKNLFAKLSMQKKTLLSFTFIFALFATAIGGATLALKSLTGELENAIQNDLMLKDIVRQFDASVLEQQSAEKSFILSQSEADFNKFEELTKTNKELVAKAKAIDLEYTDEVPWANLDKWYGKYLGEFTDIKELIVKEGNSKAGLRGELRSYAHDIEKLLGKYKFDPMFSVHLLTFRRREKDFLLRRDAKYLGKVKKDAAKFNSLLNKKNYSLIAKDQVRKAVSNYIGSFEKLIKNQEKLDALKVEAENSLTNFNKSILETVSVVDTKSTERITNINSFKDKLYTGILAGAGFIAFLIFLFQRNFSSSIRRIAELSEKLKESAVITEKSSVNMSSASEKVSSSATEQASAIQETVATLNEITSMVNKSVENAKTSSQKANESHRVANDGKKAVNDMVDAIGEINGSNNEIMTEMTRSNQEIAKIVEVINEISEKTRVINDIVFQTKLLSFNASVEAARAGEHGKGFAVVAEEVGNLAQMSGNAAQEIEELLGGSIRKVQTIVDETQGKVETLIQDAKGKIDSGVTVANRCGDILDNVVDNVESVTKMMAEISSASEEQAEGINNITTAMNELDESTHSNSDVAHETSSFANELSNQTKVLNGIVEDLDTEILGQSENYKPKAEVSDHAENVAYINPTAESKDLGSDFPEEDDPRFKEVI